MSPRNDALDRINYDNDKDEAINIQVVRKGAKGLFLGKNIALLGTLLVTLIIS